MFQQVFNIFHFFISRNWPTLGGYSTKEEMCLAFITYYPKIDLGKSAPLPLEIKIILNPLLQSVATRWFPFKNSSATSVFMDSTG